MTPQEIADALKPAAPTDADLAELRSLLLAQQLPREQLVAIQKQHVDRYSNLLQQAAQGSPNVREGECRELLAAWHALEACDFDVARAPYPTLSELVEYLASEDLLGEEL